MHLKLTSCVLYCTDQLIAPTFTKKLKDLGIALGSSVSMECKVSGSVPMTILWHKDGKEIMDSNKYKLSQQDNTLSLELNQLEIADCGIYTCRVSNIAGTDECRSKLTVKGVTAFAFLLIHLAKFRICHILTLKCLMIEITILNLLMVQNSKFRNLCSFLQQICFSSMNFRATKIYYKTNVTGGSPTLYSAVQE